jgi:glutathione S-transferase
MIKIYGALNSRASRNVWLALELGLQFEHVPVIQASRIRNPNAHDAPLNTESPEFRQINPAGTIPVLEDGGLILQESLAINLHLARSSRHNALAPLDTTEDALLTMWTLWAATECEPHGVTIIVNRAIRLPQDQDETALANAILGLDVPFKRLAKALVDGNGHLVGGRFTVADLNVAEVLRYAQSAVELFERHQVVSDWLSRCQSRSSFIEMTARRDAETLPDNWRSAYLPQKMRAIK